MMAQPDRPEGGPDREALRERMDAMVVGFLTEELELDANVLLGSNTLSLRSIVISTWLFVKW